MQLPFRPALRLRIFFTWTARTVLPLKPFLQLFSFSVLELKIEKLFGIFGSRSVVVSITIFYHKFLHAYLHRNISRDREINSSD